MTSPSEEMKTNSHMTLSVHNPSALPLKSIEFELPYEIASAKVLWITVLGHENESTYSVYCALDFINIDVPK